MRRLLPQSVAFAVIVATSLNAPASAGQPDTSDGITADHAWAGATPGPVRNGAVHLTITDNGAPDRITRVSTPIAEGAGMHAFSNDNGIMRMRPVQSLAVARGRPVIFAPGGYHIMVTGLKHPLTAGETFPLTLAFERSVPVTVAVTVERAGARGPSDHDAMHGGKDLGSMSQ